MVATDFYKDILTSPKLFAMAQSMPYVLNAFGVPIDVVAHSFVKVVAQEPGKVTGKSYSFLGRMKLARHRADDAVPCQGAKYKRNPN